MEALGYVNRTTPLLLWFTSSLRLVVLSSLVWTEPPNPSRLTVSPTLTGWPATAALAAWTVSVTASWAFSSSVLSSFLPAFLPFEAGALVSAGLAASTTSVAVFWAFSTSALSVLVLLAVAFFLVGRTGAGGGVLRFLSSTGMV